MERDEFLLLEEIINKVLEDCREDLINLMWERELFGYSDQILKDKIKVIVERKVLPIVTEH